MKDLWKNHRAAVISAIAAFVVIVGLVIGYAVLSPSNGGPVEVTSAWPVASSERAVAKPPAPLKWPLTGVAAPDEKAIDRRPFAVKIENSPAARPQTGMQRADVVYESLVEGGITRFNCIFHSDQEGIRGPVRSARLSDLHIVPQYNALFAFSGANTTVNGRIRKAGLDNLSEDAGVSYPYYRSTSKAAPHNLFLDMAKLKEEAKRRKMTLTGGVEPFMFERRNSETTPTITEITVPFSDANRAVWTYDGERDVYARVNNGRTHTDAETGKQLTARNVVVLWAKTSSAGHDSAGSTTLDITLSGENRASVFRNGQRFDGVWKTDGKTPPRLFTRDGSPIRLSVGNTWMQVIPTNVNISMK